MKHRKTLGIVLLVVFALYASLLVACGDKDKEATLMEKLFGTRSKK